MKKVYVTGLLKGINEAVTKRNQHNLSLTCRKILIAEHFPVCPVLSAADWQLDPRLPASDEWWVKTYYAEFIRECDLFCYVPVPPGIKCNRVEIEMNIWRVIGKSQMVSSDVIMKYLLSGDYE